MRCNLSLDLTDEQLLALGIHLSGKNRKATRLEAKAFIEALVKNRLAKPGNGGKTTLMPMVCPKCNKPIAVEVPVYEIKAVPPAEKQPALELSAEKAPIFDQAKFGITAKKAGEALIEFAKLLEQVAPKAGKTKKS